MRLGRAIALGAGAAAAALGAMLAGDVARLVTPKAVQDRPVEWGAAALAAGLLLAEARARGRGGRSARLLAGADPAVSWSLRRGASLAPAAWALLLLAAWLPHYPSWPWGRDADAFAEAARLWDLGVLPYRDVRSYNFPGHIYLHWGLGKAFGWGRPGWLYAADAAALLALGGAALAWSRRRLGGAAPGLLAYLMFLAAYLDMHFELTAERDWHAALGAVLALTTLQAWPGRAGLWASAAMAGAAFAIRPHLVVFLPALGLAAWDGGEGGRRRRAARLAEGSAAFAAAVALGFAPLVVAGVLDDLARNLRIASYGGPYSTFTPGRALAILVEQVSRPTTAALGVALAAMSSRGPLKREARAWLLALAGVLAYRPLHPVDHGYLKTPLLLVQAIAWALPIAWCLRRATSEGASRRRRFLTLLGLLVLLYECVPARLPYNCSFRAAWDAVRSAALGRDGDVPPGAYIWFSPDRLPSYPWGDYLRTLRYVRERTGPDTVVANVLKRLPLPAVNGPTGRPSPFRAETGIAWMWLVDEDLDAAFARQLRDAGPDSVVVWSPEERDAQPRLPLRRLTAAILEHYRPEARFGPIEVWRRAPAPPRGDAG